MGEKNGLKNVREREERRLWAMRENLNYRGELQQRAYIWGIIFIYIEPCLF